MIGSISSAPFMHNSIGCDKSRLKIPMMDFASTIYLLERRSKSQSKREISFTKDLTLSMVSKEIITVVIRIPLLSGL